METATAPPRRLLLLLLAAALPSLAQRPVPALTPPQQTEAHRLLDLIRRDPRGPYGPIRWYCQDGRVLPPHGTPCRPSPGFQHAAPSLPAQQIARLHFDLARFLANMPFEEFLDQPRNHHFPRQLVLIDYLAAAHNGWIYRRALQRRGVRQAEDEESAARRLLQQLYQDPAWVDTHYLLALQLTAVLPHGIDSGRTRRIRALSTQLATEDLRFLPLRSKIHSRPGPEDIPAVEAFIRERQPSSPAGFLELLRLMREEYTLARAAELLPGFQKRLKGSAVDDELDTLLRATTLDSHSAFEAGSALSLAIRRALTQPSPQPRQLDLAGLQVWLLNNAFRYGAAEGAPAGTRRQRLAAIRHWLRYATGAGLLSFRQLDALESAIAALPSPLDAAHYESAARDLNRALEWARASINREFGPVQRHYVAVEPLAADFIDDLLRRSVALHLARHTEYLLADAEAAIGRRHAVLGQPSSRGVFALNPGFALAPLDLVEPGQEATVRLDPNRIYVIPETLEHLSPVKGILTLDSGNALSHTQLLAANLGIPNATIPSRLLPELRKYKGQRLLYAVTPGGAVILRPWDSLTPAEQQVWTNSPVQSPTRVPLDTSRLRLDVTRVLPLSELSASSSGILSGPKAANVAELARRFPGMVSPAIVIPFGIYHQHLQSAANGQLSARIRSAYAEAERLRAAGAPIDQIRAFIYPRLAEFRQTIQTLPLLPAFEQALSAQLDAAFGPDGSYGVFVRSDTNAEDLPQFTGAGLNLTVPNVSGRARILDAIRAVWASPFAERAYEWRARALAPGSEVLPSILIQRTVNADKSGVLVTINLDTLNRSEITVNVNEGVAAVVEGGVAESLLLRPDGSVKLLAQARAPYRRVALPTGGFDEIATSGAHSVLLPAEIQQLRQLVAQVESTYPKALDERGEPLPWDIEFGFEKGQLRLFQIRPLVRFRERATLERLAQLEGPAPAPQPVRLDQPPALP